MNDFDIGNLHGRFFWSVVYDWDFIGLALRIGEDFVGDDLVDSAFHITLCLGSFCFSVGIVTKWKGEGK